MEEVSVWEGEIVKKERKCQEKEINKSKAEQAVNKIYNWWELMWICYRERIRMIG